MLQRKSTLMLGVRKENLMKIDWKAKLSSRKFWAALTAVVISLLAFFNVPEMTQTQITALLAAVGTLVAYIFGESYIDAKAQRAPRSIEESTQIKEDNHGEDTE